MLAKLYVGEVCRLITNDYYFSVIHNVGEITNIRLTKLVTHHGPVEPEYLMSFQQPTGFSPTLEKPTLTSKMHFEKLGVELTLTA